MAHTTTFTETRTDTNLPMIVRDAMARVRTSIDGRRARSRLRWELNQYSNRELADMGMSRSDIDGIVARSHGG
ncbi:DUF1127 domain-containing protein [Lichenicola cladoniae]|uniref:DUF1127 domain-containing protein n=1 Tax=Lichenicola cladoniae TaxID=1484109 RepID=A0A6M8HTP0_9PROT|nr:DUF1127 domain-containing protein [Lichenicola cladoniae]NPD67620.1 DUF1127 domain-containing protein [Acetobacteraceae bacterium]QKE91738.1 DUF1127 domain-containing protein [Lichenicola cladoniae]